MGKKITTLCVFAIVVSLALPAFAAVQNIKIGGDVTVRSLVRADYSLDKTGVASASTNNEEYFMHSLGINVVADLTDNVSVNTRIINERDWDNNSAVAGVDFDADIDLAYVTLKEMIYAPLTVTAGRQDMWLGKGFIIGARLLDVEGSIGADEYTENAGFDAIRGTLDLDPWTIDLFYIKMDENTLAAKDDLDIYGINVGYIFDQYNAETEGYFIAKFDRGPQVQAFPTAGDSNVHSNDTLTLGARGSLEPGLVENTTVAFEIARQFGKYSQIEGLDTVRARRGWAADISGEKRWPEWVWSPKLTLEYIFYSGEEDYTDTDAGGWHAWDPMYRGKFDTAIREFQNYYYATSQRAANVAMTEVDMDSGLTNQHQFLIKGAIKPIRHLTTEAVLATFWLDEALRVAGTTQPEAKELGKELDLLLTYEYSEDLTFSLLFAQFYPGKYWLSNQDEIATDLVVSVKLTF